MGDLGLGGRVAELYPQSNLRTLKGFGILGKIESKSNFKEPLDPGCVCLVENKSEGLEEQGAGSCSP